jgi:putative transposase
MDKGYDYPEVYELLEDYGYTIHIRLRGEYRANCKRIPDTELDIRLLKEPTPG